MIADPQTPPPSRAEERQAPPDVATSCDVGARAVELPALLTPSQVGKACNMSRRAAKNLLRGAGIAEHNDANGRWHVAADALRSRLPDVYARVAAWFARGGDDAV